MNVLRDQWFRRRFMLLMLLGILCCAAALLPARTLSASLGNRLMSGDMAAVGILVEEYGADPATAVSAVMKGQVSAAAAERGRAVLDQFGYLDSPGLLYGMSGRTAAVCVLLALMVCVLFLAAVFLVFRGLYGRIAALDRAAENAAAMKRNVVFPRWQEGAFSSLSNHMQQMNDRLSRSVSSLRNEKVYLKDFLSDISHQIRTPLSSVTVYADLLLSRPDMDRAERVSFLERIMSQLGRMRWLIEGLLKMARLEAGAISFAMGESDLMKTLAGSAAALDELAVQKNIIMDIRGPGDLPLIHDHSWMQEALINLLKNAVEHSPAGGRIDITVTATPLIAEVVIRDYGPGFAPGEEHRIFDRFYQSSASPNPAGIGIGLSLSRSIAEAHQGTLVARNARGGGAELILTLPVSQR